MSPSVSPQIYRNTWVTGGYMVLVLPSVLSSCVIRSSDKLGN